MNWTKSSSSSSSNNNSGFIPCEIRDNGNVLVYDKLKFIVSDEWAKVNGNLDFSKKDCYNAVSVFTGIGAVTQNKIQFTIFAREDGFSCGISKELRNGSKDWKSAIKTLGIDSDSYERITDGIIDAWLVAGQKRQWKSWSELSKKSKK